MAHANARQRMEAIKKIKNIATTKMLKDLAKEYGCSISAVNYDLKVLKGIPIKSYYKKTSRPFLANLRMPIFERDGNECQYCCTREAKRFIIEHIIPVSKGGTYARENLVVACSTCNYIKRAKIWIPKNFMEISKDNLPHQTFVLENAVKDFR